MTLLEQAEELRDRMCAQAPDAVTAEIGDNKWALAVLCSEAFWKFHNDIKGKEPQLDPMCERVVNLFAEGRSVTYITFYLWLKSEQEAMSMLKDAHIPVTDHPAFNYDMLIKNFGDKSRNDYYIPKKQDKHYGIYQQEQTVLSIMVKTGMSIPDIAVHAGRPMPSLFNNLLRKKSGSFNEYLMVGGLWQRGFSIRCISYITCISESRVIQLLRELNCTTMKNTAFDFNVSDVNIAGEKERIGGIISPYLQKPQLVMPEGCSKNTTETVINKMRDDGNTYTSIDVGRMFGVPAHIAEKICDEHYFVLADKRW